MAIASNETPTVPIPLPHSICRVRIELLEPLLATLPSDPNIWDRFFKDTAQSDEEGTITPTPGVSNIFPSDPQTGEVFLWDYQILGFLKEIGNLQAVKDYLGIRNLRAKISQHVRVFPRRLYTGLLARDLETVQRPLRARTPQGERVALAKSQMLPAGYQLEFFVVVLDNPDIEPETIRTLLEMGQWQGLGQWRSGSWGRFKLVRFDVSERVTARPGDGRAKQRRAAQ